MAKSFHSGGTVNATNWSVYAPGSVYTPNYSMRSARQALDGTRPIQLVSWTPDSISGNYTATLHYPGSVSPGTILASSGGKYTFRIKANSGTVTPGRSVGDGFNMIWDSDGKTVAGGISHRVFYNEVPAAPTNIQVTPAGGTTVNVTWSHPTDNGGTAMTEYVAQASATPDFASIASSATVSGSSTSASISGLSNGSWYIRVLPGNAVSDARGTHGPASQVVQVQTGPVWTFAGESSLQVQVTNGGNFSDPAGPITLWAAVPVSSIPVGLMCYGHLAFYAINSWNGVSLRTSPKIQWFASDGSLVSETVLPDEIVPLETTHVFTWPMIGRPRNAVIARLVVELPQFFAYPEPNVVTAGSFDPDFSTQLYIDGAMISNRETEFFDGSFPNSAWFGQPGLSASYQRLGDEQPLFDLATDGDGRMLRINNGEIREEVLSTTIYPLSIDTPVPSDISPAPLGSYNLIDSTDTKVPAAVWSEAGGFVHARPGDELGQIILTLYAPDNISGYPGPYTLASSVGATQIPELRLSGRGVRESPEVIRLATGVDESISTVVGLSVDSPAIATTEDAYDAGIWAVQSTGGPNPVLTATLSLKDIEGFGVTPGSLVKYRNSQYRITDVQISGLSARITAELFVRAEESDALWVGEDVDARDAIWAGRKAKDGVIAALRTT